MSLGGPWTRPTSFTLLDAFLGAGGNFIDTADVYSKWVPGHSGGESETIVGRWVASRRNRSQVLIATKVGNEMGPGTKGLSRAYIVREVEDSLRRLQTDHIDLYQSHVDDPDTPMEETLGAYADLIRQGKVRAIGASNFTAERLAQALAVSAQHGYPRYESLQPLYNLYERAGYESALEPLCLKEHIGVIGYSSLGSGFLTGKYRSEADLGKSPRGQGVQTPLLQRPGIPDPGRARRGREALRDYARRRGARLADRAPERDIPDRERHDRRSAERAGGGDAAWCSTGRRSSGWIRRAPDPARA